MTFGDRYGLDLKISVAVKIERWLEHIVQAYQVCVMGYERPHALVLLGRFCPRLVDTEWMRFGYSVLIWLGLVVLREGFSRSAQAWWDAAATAEIWHSFEPIMPFLRAQGGFALWGTNEPTSVAGLFCPRMESYSFYNFIIILLIIISMIISRRGQSSASNIGTVVGSA